MRQEVSEVEGRRAFSERLGQLSQEQLQAALDRFGLGKLVQIRPTSSGLFGQNVFLTSESGDWVLRGAPHWPWQFEKERLFADLLHRHTAAPVPWPYLVERSQDLFGWSYALMPRLPGTPPSELRERIGREEFREIAGVIGGGLAELHRLTAPEPGEYDPIRGGIRPHDSSFGDWVIRSLREWQAKSLATPGALDEADLALIDTVASDTRWALVEPFQPCCVHHDFKEGNLLVERAGGHWRLTGVFDLMTCAFGDGEQDLSRMTASLAFPHRQVARAFLAGYTQRRPLRPGHAERFKLYMLMDRLILWEYGRRNRVWFPDEARFRDFVNPFLALDSLLDESAG